MKSFITNKRFLSADSKLLAILDQGISSGMSFIVMFCVTDIYSLKVIAILNLVNNISYSFATIVKSQLLYSSLLHSEISSGNSDINLKKLVIPKLQIPLILLIGFIVFLISNSKADNFRLPIVMFIFFIGIFLTDFFRNVLIHNGLRLISFKLNILSVIALVVFISMQYLIPEFFDLIIYWSILQFIFPLYIFIKFFEGEIKFLKGLNREKVTGRYFLIESVFSRFSMVLGSLYIFFANSEVAGEMAIAYLIFSALPSLISSALQPITNGLVIRNVFGKPFQSIVIITYLIHLIWFPIFLYSISAQPQWFPVSFQSAKDWCVGIVFASMTTSFLNLYQIRMLGDLGGSIFLITRLTISLFMGPIGAIVIINLSVSSYIFYTLILLFIANPFSYTVYLKALSLPKSKSSKEY